MKFNSSVIPWPLPLTTATCSSDLKVVEACVTYAKGSELVNKHLVLYVPLLFPQWGYVQVIWLDWFHLIELTNPMCTWENLRTFVSPFVPLTHTYTGGESGYAA